MSKRRYRKSNFTFDTTAKIYRPRTRFNLSHELICTMNVGTLYPVDVQEVYPGDEFIDKDYMVSQVLSSYLKPTLGNLMMDFHVFFVPCRLVFDDWEYVFGNASPSQYSTPTYASVPTFDDITGSSSLSYTPQAGTVADFVYGIPAAASGFSGSSMKMSVLPARAFALIYEEWYRDENNVNPVQVQKGDVVASEKFNNDDWSPTNYTGKLPRVRKIHDYFTSCLPAPQKGSSVSAGITTFNDAPVVPVGTILGEDIKSTSSYIADKNTDLTWMYSDIPHPPYKGTPGKWFPITGYPGIATAEQFGATTISGAAVDPAVGSGGGHSIIPRNLWALNSATNSGGGFTVNDLRLAFQAQRILERDARTGSRYAEYIRAAFGVAPSDARLQRPEYIAGWRVPMSVQTVPQTSAGTEDSPLGALAAYSHSGGKGRWHKAFDEHGFVFICASIRQLHVYQQGVERYLWRKTREDFYDPEYAHIGEQPVLKRELYFAGADTDEDVFGYQEAFADLRYRPSRICGQARSGAKLPNNAESDFDIWHYGDNYASAPTLNADFIEEIPDYVDRDLSVPSTSQDQFLVNFYFKRDGIRPLPSRGTPGLIDHTYGYGR